VRDYSPEMSVYPNIHRGSPYNTIAGTVYTLESYFQATVFETRKALNPSQPSEIVFVVGFVTDGSPEAALKKPSVPQPP